MTGFGGAKGSTSAGEVSIEIKSVNHRSVDLIFRGTREFTAMEHRIRDLARRCLPRGRIEIFIDLKHRSAESVNLRLDLQRAEKYLGLAGRLNKELGVGGELTLDFLLRAPDVVYEEEKALDAGKVWSELGPLVDSALQRVEKMRSKEGRRLATDIRKHLRLLEKTNRAISKLRRTSIVEYKTALQTRLRELADNVQLDPGRLEQEVAYLVDKSDISEEIIRIDSHLEQLGLHIKGGGVVGRQLDFLCQELVREANTIGSKTQNIHITRHVLAMKAEIEKIREQSQNIQ